MPVIVFVVAELADEQVAAPCTLVDGKEMVPAEEPWVRLFVSSDFPS